MIRVLLFIALFSLLATGAQTIDDRIKATDKQLKRFDRNFATINANMAKTAKAILEKKRTVLKQQKRIDALQKNLDGKTASLNEARERLQKLTEKQERLESAQHHLESELADLIARALSLTLVQDDNNTLSPDAVIGETVIDALQQQTRREIDTLGNRYRSNRKALKTLTAKTAALQATIAKIEKEKRTLLAARKANEKALAELTAKKRSYKTALKNLLSQKEQLQKTLQNLHIIRQTEEQREREKEERKRNRALLASKPLPKVKSVGSSYHRASTRRYRGKKTIAPLDRYTVLKRYGTYTDPIYHIKIFNESVTLKPAAPDAKVKAVFNGKVILAQYTPLLENVVIIEHAGGLHTIYAHLDRIAPTVKKGKRLKKGSVIGRVNDELMFEVTQKNYHIDPLQVIR